MRELNVIYDIDDTLVETLDLFFFSDNLLTLTYLDKINKSQRRINFEKIFEELPKYSSLDRTVKEEINNQPEDIKNELLAFKEAVRKSDDEIMEKWPKQGRNPFSSEGFQAAIEDIVNKYNLQLRRKDTEYLSLIPFHYKLKTKYPLLSIKELIKESLEFNVKIHLYSKGSFKSQVRKIEYLSLNEIIPLDNLYIVHKKDTETLREIILERGLKNTIVIGNSLKEEILPALNNKELGINALWVKHNDYFSKGLNHKDNHITQFSKDSFLKLIKEFLYD